MIFPNGRVAVEKELKRSFQKSKIHLPDKNCDENERDVSGNKGTARERGREQRVDQQALWAGLHLKTYINIRGYCLSSNSCAYITRIYGWEKSVGWWGKTSLFFLVIMNSNVTPSFKIIMCKAVNDILNPFYKSLLFCMYVGGAMRGGSFLVALCEKR